MKRRALVLGTGGVALSLPSLSQAQQKMNVRRIGVLMSTSETDPQERSSVAAFVQALDGRGWTAGQNVEIVYRWSDGDSARMAANARELVGTVPAVMLVKGGNLPAAQQATSTIPIVFVVLSDIVADKFVSNLARPAGNITGFASPERELAGKRLELLRDVVPGLMRVLYIRSRRTGSDTDGLYRAIIGDAAIQGIAVSDGAADSEAEIAQAVESFARGAGGGMVVAFDAFTTVHRAQIVALAARHRLPAVYPLRVFAESGGLLSYGFIQSDQFKAAASYVDRILRGEKVGELPVQRPTAYELLLNAKTAKGLGLTIPPSIIARADEVIE